MDQRSELAGRWGIETGYFDIQGGWHEADAEAVRRVAEALSACGSAPADSLGNPQVEQAFQGDGRRLWVLAVQLYAVRSQRNWGHGDFTDLGRLLELVADVGGAGVGLNPLHALFYDRPGSASPYSPNSRLFLNPLYIDVEAIEEFPGVDAIPRDQIDRLRATELVDYPAVAGLKLTAMRKVYRAFLSNGSEARRQDFATYRQERGQTLARFAAFETLRHQCVGPWWDWPEPWQRPDEEALRELRRTHAEELGFHEFLQWNAERQLAQCRAIAQRRGLGIGLYLDTAVGVEHDGADAWMEQATILRGVSIGAPPDQYNPAGQNWGLTTYNPHGLIVVNFEPFRQMLAAAMRYAGAIRIDHVLGLQRLFVIPHGLQGDRGIYLRLPLGVMLATVAEESRRWRCIVVGEDLGTVPEGFRGVLSEWGIWCYRVMLFERGPHASFRPAGEYAEKAVATFGTHDLPTFAGWISGRDLHSKRGIGVDPGESDEERQASRTALQAAVAAGGPPRFEDVASFLAAAPTRLVSMGIEDVLEMTDQPNVPGTIEQHPNWRIRWPIAFEDAVLGERLRGISSIMARAGRSATD